MEENKQDQESVGMKKKKRTAAKRKRTSRRKRRKGSDIKKVVLAALLISVAAVSFFLIRFYITYTHESKYDANNPYPVRGVDVSHYQGNIDWELFEEQGVSFAFIKATEGKRLVDPNFEYNWENAKKAGIRRGAYHFLRFDVPGKAQARNFINTVPKGYGDLPPVVDIELYGKYHKPGGKPSFNTVEQILTPLLRELEERYGRRPVIYTNRSVYYTYLVLKYRDYELWLSHPGFDTGRHRENAGWIFCQYSFTGTLKGMDSKHVDLNVFNGTRWDFRKY